jgi:hypothetical protein
MKGSWMFASLVLLAAAPALAQSNIAAGELHGVITDPSGAIVPAAKVTVTNETTGFSRRTLTDENGEYRMLLVPPGIYALQVERAGFHTRVAKDVQVTVGQIAVVDMRLELGAISVVVEVTGTQSLIEGEKTHQANTLEKRYIEALPIDRRDYLTFSLLAPGVVDSKALADNSDFRVKQTPTSGLSFYGSNGRGNFIAVDGGEANDDGGGVRETISQEAIHEFQINRGNYSAEFGGASGAVINIVSKAGTNQLHGTLFGFFRTSSLDAGSPFAKVWRDGTLARIKPESDRQQFGATAGLPIKKDRTFLFAAFEGLRRNESSVVSLLTDRSIFQPTAAQQKILETLPGDAAARLRSALTSPQSTIELFERNTGLFPFTTRNWQFSTRLDHRLSGSDQLLFRYNYTHPGETNSNIHALVGATRGTSVAGYDSTSLLGWTHAFSERTLNEARVQWDYRSTRMESLEKFGPEINIPGFGFFNRDLFLPSYNLMRRYEFRDNFSYFRGNHGLKFGGGLLERGLHAESHTFFAGRFTFGSLPGTLVDPALSSTTINALQAFNLGLAQTYQQGMGNPTVAATLPYFSLYLQDSWKALPNLTFDVGLRYELEIHRAPMHTDTNNFAPRFSFSWDPANDKRTVVRGGYGIYYSPIYRQIDWVVKALGLLDGQRQIAQVFMSIQTPGASSAANIFSALRKQQVIGVPTPTRMITPADVSPFGIVFTHTGPLPPFTVLFENSPDYVNPYTQQASFGVERKLRSDMTVSATYTYVRTLKITRARDRNLLTAPVDPRLGIRVWSTPYFVDPGLAQLNVYESTGRAFYSGLVLEMKKRFSRCFSLDANYTFSKAIDEVVDYNSDFQASDQTNLRAERALSSFDQRHKFVAYGIWQAPAGFELAHIFRAYSGRPFNLLAGTDLNGDRHSSTDRPVGAGRNTGIGPNFWTFDLRLGRSFHLTDFSRLEVMAEGFNLFNCLNYASINNTVGNIPGPFNLYGRSDRSPSEPLGFTSAYDLRRVQFGVRLRF